MFTVLALASIASAAVPVSPGESARPPASPRATTGAYDNFLAPASVCPNNDLPTLLISDQVDAMLCMINYARRVRGLAILATSPMLATSAGIKADDIVRCNDFSHTACGRAVNAPFEQSGYIASDVSWEVGENLAYGTNLLGSPRSIMRAWLESDGHRANIFTAEWRDQGVALRKPNAVLGLSSNAVWVSHFGRRASARDGGFASGPGDGGSAGGPGDGGSAGGPGGGGSGSRRSGGSGGTQVLRLSVRPATVRSGRRIRFRFVVTARGGGAVAQATVSLASRRTRTDSRGRASIRALFRRPGRYRAVATKRGSRRATATVRAVR